MTERRKISLTVLAAPGTAAVLTAPPVLEASDHTIDYACGNCGTILMHAELDQVHNLIIQCTACDSYNSTDL
jgi:DNA-directed RNA polymerase subunit RPC12/RpoP